MKIIMDSQKRIDGIFRFNHVVEREYGIERIKIYAYTAFSDRGIHILGELISNGYSVKRQFKIKCTAYDEEGDVLVAQDAKPFIYPEEYFDRFPFKADLFIAPGLVKEITVEPVSTEWGI